MHIKALDSESHCTAPTHTHYPSITDMTAWLILPLALQVIAALATPVPGNQGGGNGQGQGNGHAGGGGHGHDAQTTLAREARQAGKLYYGTEISSYYMANSTFSAITNTQFNQITPENEMKWEVIHPARNTYNWTGSDLVCTRVADACAGWRLTSRS